MLNVFGTIIEQSKRGCEARIISFAISLCLSVCRWSLRGRWRYSESKGQAGMLMGHICLSSRFTKIKQFLGALLNIRLVCRDRLYAKHS